MQSAKQHKGRQRRSASRAPSSRTAGHGLPAPADPSRTPFIARSELEDEHQPAFIVTRGSKVGRILPIAVGKWMLGRDDAADLRVTVHCVSRYHLRIICAHDKTVNIIDMGSCNGTWVNGERKSNYQLDEGDRVELGPDVELLFTYVPQASADAIARAHEPRLIDLLSPREYEVASLAVRGMTTAQIASALEVSNRTVSTHMEHIYKKLNIHKRAELARKWYA